MMKSRAIAALGAAATAALLAAPAMAASNGDENRVEVGSLSCDVGEGTGYVFGSTRELTCTYNPVEEGAQDETYVGTIKRYGIDIGKTEGGEMSWLVMAPTDAKMNGGALAGDYAGVSAEATAGVGVGANVMIGGSDETVALQPVSVSKQEGVNFALGVGEIQLKKAGS